ncbi:InlB B-repeat-containing protein [Staphylococcus epidermidis]|uniref:InlB B-repeat-containing protein n=1 Tax=Staphylococcus epidermidis TaxID=1282 RepID=UPI003DA62F2B
MGDLSSQLLKDNPWLKEGDQITLVLCYTNDSTIIQFNWFVSSFYIDPTSSVEMNSEESSIKPIGFDIAYDGAGLVFTPIDEEFIYAAACIVSREGATPMRSNATLSVNAAALPDYYGATARAKAQRSYMKALTVQSTDWPVDPDTEGGSGDDTLTYTVSQVTLNEVGQETTAVGGTVSGGGSYLLGETVSLIATPATNYLFQGWFPSKADALANTNRISANAVYAFAAGDEVFTSRTIVGKFAHEL